MDNIARDRPPPSLHEPSPPMSGSPPSDGAPRPFLVEQQARYIGAYDPKELSATQQREYYKTIEQLRDCPAVKPDGPMTNLDFKEHSANPMLFAHFTSILGPPPKEGAHKLVSGQCMCAASGKVCTKKPLKNAFWCLIGIAGAAVTSSQTTCGNAVRPGGEKRARDEASTGNSTFAQHPLVLQPQRVQPRHVQSPPLSRFDLSEQDVDDALGDLLKPCSITPPEHAAREPGTALPTLPAVRPTDKATGDAASSGTAAWLSRPEVTEQMARVRSMLHAQGITSASRMSPTFLQRCEEHIQHGFKAARDGRA